MIFSSRSRFKNTQLTIVDGKETVGVWKKPTFLTQELPNQYVGNYTVTSDTSGRPDLISYQLYDSPYYDWVLLSFNNVTDTLNWPSTGLVIKYPSISVINAGV